jgi:hypothetical protein
MEQADNRAFGAAEVKKHMDGLFHQPAEGTVAVAAHGPLIHCRRTRQAGVKTGCDGF